MLAIPKHAVMMDNEYVSLIAVAHDDRTAFPVDNHLVLDAIHQLVRAEVHAACQHVVEGVGDVGDVGDVGGDVGDVGGDVGDVGGDVDGVGDVGGDVDGVEELGDEVDGSHDSSPKNRCTRCSILARTYTPLLM